MTGIQKIVEQNSFEWGIMNAEDKLGGLLSCIVDDPQDMQKRAGDQDNEISQWKDTKPIKGHSLIHLVALGEFERYGANRNADAWKRHMLKVAHPTFITQAFLYRNHKAKPELKEGFVVKTAYNQLMGRVELLVAAAHDKCADWLGDMERGNVVPFSMGWKSLWDQCSICNHKARTRKEYCEHVRPVNKTAAPFGAGQVLPDGRKCFVFNQAGFFNDISKVPVGADMTAGSLRKVASLANELDMVVPGWELANATYKNASLPDHEKNEMIDKLAEIEKTIPAVGISVDGVDVDQFDGVEEFGLDLDRTPQVKVASFLHENDILLPIRLFAKIALASEYDAMRGTVEEAASLLPGCWSRLSVNPDARLRVSANASYDAEDSEVKTASAFHSTNWTRFNNNSPPFIPGTPEFESRIQEGFVIKTASAPENPTPAAKAIVEEYQAYKLAWLQSRARISDSQMVDAILG